MVSRTFSQASFAAAVERTYDVEVGVCLDDDLLQLDNNLPFAPLPCADAIFNISGEERHRLRE